jgi:hypothetical protein
MLETTKSREFAIQKSLVGKILILNKQILKNKAMLKKEKLISSGT